MGVYLRSGECRGAADPSRILLGPWGNFFGERLSVGVIGVSGRERLRPGPRLIGAAEPQEGVDHQVFPFCGELPSGETASVRLQE